MGGGISIVVWAVTATLAAFALVSVCSLIFGMLTPQRGKEDHTKTEAAPSLADCAILIATKNGAMTLGSTIKFALANQIPVYVLSDGSDDDTVAISRAAGASVVEYSTNRGKPATLHAGCQDLGLLDSYRFLTIIDDDTHLEPDFVARSLEYFDADTAVVVGRTCTLWPPSLRWNPFIAYRAFGYWFYQLTVRTPQSWANAMNCISGSNSTYRTSVLREVLVEETPYIVDDTYWVLETHRLSLGRIRYGSRAWAWIQDPTTLKDFYKQNLRWLWGTNQGIVGHRIGLSLLRGRPTVFETLYALLIANWAIYLLGIPLLLLLWVTQGFVAVVVVLSTRWIAFYLLAAIASIRLRHFHLILLAPVLVVVDLLFRVIWIHSIFRTIAQPKVASCVWDSPTRIAS